MPVIGDKMNGGGRIEIITENSEWILELHTDSGELYQYKDKFSNVLMALHVKKDLEKEAGDSGSLKLLYDGKDILWLKNNFYYPHLFSQCHF